MAKVRGFAFEMREPTEEEESEEHLRSIRYNGPGCMRRKARFGNGMGGPTTEGFMGRREDMGFAKQRDRNDDDGIPKLRHSELLRRKANGND